MTKNYNFAKFLALQIFENYKSYNSTKPNFCLTTDCE